MGSEIKTVIIGTVVFIVVVIMVSFTFGWLDIGMAKTFGVRKADIQREIFESTTSYNKGMADDLANYRFEFELTEDPVERKAIIRLIVSRYADFDAHKLENQDLAQWLIDIRNGEIK